MGVSVSVQRYQPGDVLGAQLVLLGELLRPSPEPGVEVDECSVEVEEGEGLHGSTLSRSCGSRQKYR